MDFVDIMTDHDGDETFYMLLNEFGSVHFMLSKNDMDIAVFR